MWGVHSVDPRISWFRGIGDVKLILVEPAFWIRRQVPVFSCSLAPDPCLTRKQFRQVLHVSYDGVVLNSVRARGEQIIDAALQAIQQNLVPCLLIVQLAFVAEILEYSHMVIIESPERDTRHDVIVVNKAIGPIHEILIEVSFEILISCAR